MNADSRWAPNNRFTATWAKRENSLEDRNIAQYEKLLGIKRKRKQSKVGSKKLPQSFVNDGLDYILGVLNRDDAEAEEQTDKEAEEDSPAESDFEDEKSTKASKTHKNAKAKSGLTAEKNSTEVIKNRNSSKKNAKRKAERGDSVGSDSESDATATKDASPSRKRVRFSNKNEVQEFTRASTAAKVKEKVARDPAGTSTESADRNLLTPSPSPGVSRLRVQREVSVSDRLARLVRAALNRLSVANLAAILAQLDSTVLQSGAFTRAEVVQAIADHTLNACALAKRVALERIALDYAVLIASLHGRGAATEQLASRLVERLCVALHAVHERIVHASTSEIGSGNVGDDDDDRNQLLNAAQFLCSLFQLRVVHSVLIFGLLQRLAASFTEADIDVILLIVRRCGIALRKSSPTELKTFLDSMDAKQRDAQTSTAGLSKRAHVLLDLIVAIKNNNHRKVPGYAEATQLVEEYLAALRRVGARIGQDELHVPFDEFLEAEQRGRWWLVGSSWTDKESQRPARQSEVQAEGDKIDAASRKLRLNTDVRKQLFRLLVTSHDAEDAFLKVTQFASARKASANSRAARCRTIHEAIRLACTCAMRERAHNPFYAQLVSRLAAMHRTYKRYVLLVFWDHLRSMQLDSVTWLTPADAENQSWLTDSDTSTRKEEVQGDAKLRRIANLASLLVALLKSGAMNLALTLKPVDFAEMQPAQMAFLRSAFVRMLELDENSCAQMFAPLADRTHADRLLRDAVSMFLNHFMRKAAKSRGRTELVDRIKLVTEHVLVNAD